MARLLLYRCEQGDVMIALKHILVATDFGAASEAALTYGRELARVFSASLEVLHVVPVLGAQAMEFPLPAYGDLQLEAEASARIRLNALLYEEDRQALHAKATVLTSSSPAQAIAGYAKDAVPTVDLIVMGTHGRGAMVHVVLGSVAEKVVRTAPCPVLTVRHPQHEFVLPNALEAVVRA